MYTDEQIVRMVQESPQKREDAMKYFFKDSRLKNTVIEKIKRKGGEEYDAEEAFQEGFKVFYKQLLFDKFQGRSSLRTYFVGICIRCWLDGLKKSFYKRTTFAGEEPSLDEEYQHTPEVDLIAKERKTQMREILGLLGDKCKKVILLGYQGYSGEEIKAQLQLAADELVRKVRYRCMSKLKSMLEKEPHLMSVLKDLSYG